MNAKNNPYYNAEFERAVREAGLARAVMIGEALADGIAAVGRGLRHLQKTFARVRNADVPLTPRATAAQQAGSGD